MALKKAVVIDTAESNKELQDQPGSEQVVAKDIPEVVHSTDPEIKDDESMDAGVKDDAGTDAGTVDEPVFEQEQVKSVASQPTEVAVQSAANSEVVVPHKPSNAMANFSKEMAEEGFEGMVLTGQSFDRVKQHEAMFQLGSEEISLGDRIEVQIMSTQNIYIVRQFKGDKGAEIYYSYDPQGATKADGSSAADTLAEWLDDGYGDEEHPLDIKCYTEAMAMLVNRTDEYNEQIVMLSIPPASRSRLAGAFAVGRQIFKAGPSNLIIECKVGKKIGTGDEGWRPWLFKALRKIA